MSSWVGEGRRGVESRGIVTSRGGIWYSVVLVLLFLFVCFLYFWCVAVLCFMCFFVAVALCGICYMGFFVRV